MSFVFYDTETTGLNVTFDQILQFGAIRTDHDLNEIDRFQIRCRLSPHVVPSPGAMRVTGVTVDLLTDPSLPSHYEMVCAIKGKLDEWSPSVFIGHNSIRFDESLLRQAFYQSLHPPYLTNTNDNCRTDSLRIIQAVNQFDPGVLAIPIDGRGRQVFKLDHLAPANGFEHGAAHEAINDVKATIHLCRIVAEQSPHHWSNLIRFAKKAAVVDFVQDEGLYLLTDFYFGTAYSWPVTTICANSEYESEWFVFNLLVDPDELTDLSDKDLQDRMSVSPKPVRTLRSNAAPVVFAFEDVPAHLLGSMPDHLEIERRAASIRGNEELSDRLVKSILSTRRPKEPSVHVEGQIYEKFMDAEDAKVLVDFHESDWGECLEILSSLKDQRLVALGERLIYIEAPETMSAEMVRKQESAIAQRLLADEEAVPWLTLPKAIADTKDLLAVATGDEVNLLNDLCSYLEYRLEKAAAQMI